MQGDTVTNKPQSTIAKFLERNSGPFIGKVKKVGDPNLGGLLWVNVEEYSQTKDPSESDLIPCRYLNPFYGVSSTQANSTTDPYDYNGSQKSYGMWFVPPSIDNDVVVMFVKGEVIQAFWIGCVQQSHMNQMIPGIGATESTSVQAIGDYQQSKESIYGTGTLPSGEVNRETWDEQDGNQINQLKSPIHPFAENLRQQGLIQDTVRGTTSSSARRESPSQTFGISTPGPLNRNGKKLPIGPRLTKNGIPSQEKMQVPVDRGTGHTFVLDDGDANGDNQLVRLRSASGHQILLNDSAGVVYIANGSGNAWMEFAANGSIDVYSGGSVSVRSRGDMNFHSDANINMFSQNDIRMSAAGKLVLDGGLIQQHSDSHIQMQATEGSIMAKAPIGNYLVDVGTNIIQQSKGAQHLIGQQIHFNSVGYINNLLETFGRTSIQDPSGTGTQREIIPDVNPVAKYLSGPLKVYPQGNVSMSGMRVPTHEPYPYHFDQIVQFVGSSGSSLNDNIPGTPEFIANRNRTSANPTIRVGQFQADLQRYIEKQGLTLPTAVNKVNDAVKGAINQSTGGSISKIQTIADEFTRTYNQTYSLKDLGPLKLSPITTGHNICCGTDSGSLRRQGSELPQGPDFC
jgi:hypothetical protein